MNTDVNSEKGRFYNGDETCLLWSESQMFMYVQINFVLLNAKTFILKTNNKKINWCLFLSELYVNNYYMRFVKTLWDWSIKNKDIAEIVITVPRNVWKATTWKSSQ
jgi:hypothetical protein